jgi:hypothetical protein
MTTMLPYCAVLVINKSGHFTCRNCATSCKQSCQLLSCQRLTNIVIASMTMWSVVQCIVTSILDFALSAMKLCYNRYHFESWAIEFLTWFVFCGAMFISLISETCTQLPSGGSFVQQQNVSWTNIGSQLPRSHRRRLKNSHYRELITSKRTQHAVFHIPENYIM